MGFGDFVKQAAMFAVECTPVVGTAIAVARTAKALYNGDYKGAAMEAVGILPIGKIASKVGKVAGKALNKLAPNLLKKGTSAVGKLINKFAGSKLGKALNAAKGKADAAKDAAKNAVKKALKKIVNSPRVSAGLKRIAKKNSVKTAASGVQKMSEGAQELMAKMSQMKNAVKGKISKTKSMKKGGGKGKSGGGKTGSTPTKNYKLNGDSNKSKKLDTDKNKSKNGDKNNKDQNNNSQTPTKNQNQTKNQDKNNNNTQNDKINEVKQQKGKNQSEQKKKCEKDPINVVTGAFDLRRSDLKLNDLGIGIEIKRGYDSRDTSIGIMGRGWSFKYETKLLRNNNEIILVTGDGDLEVFNKENDTWNNQIVSDKRKVLIEHKNKYELIVKNKETYTYDKEGKLISISDINNNTTILEYTEDQIKTITSPGGKKLYFTYENGKITKIVDNINRQLHYRYDGDNLIEVEFPNGGVVVYEYINNLITSIRNRNDVKFINNEYDMLGRVVKQTNRIGEVIDIKYDDKERVTTFISRDTGCVEKYKYNQDNLMIEKVFGDETSEKWTYNKNNIIDSFTDRNGNTTKWIYNDEGNITEEILPTGHTTTNTYDDKGNLVKVETKGGKEISYSYDDKDNLIEEKVKLSYKEYATIKHTYDTRGRETSRTDGENNTIKYYYERDDLNTPTEIVDSEGNRYIYEYDKAGRDTSIQNDYGKTEFYNNPLDKKTHIIDAKGNTTRILYNKVGRLTKIIPPKNYIKSSDNGIGHEYRYDMFNRVIKEIDHMNGVKRLKYDADGNLVKEIDQNHYNPVIDDGLGIEYIYTKGNKRIKEIYPDKGTRRIEYDKSGNITKIITPNNYNEETDDGEGLTYEYDTLNRLTLIKDPEGNVLRKFIYDIDGNLVKEIDAKGYVYGETDERRFGKLYKYNLAGWLIEERVPVDVKENKVLYNITKYEYNKNGDKLRESRSPEYVGETDFPSKWHHIDYTYDKNGRVINIKDTEGGEISYTYDCLNNRTSEKIKINDEKYKVTKFKYDSTGNLEKLIRYIDGEDLKDSVNSKEFGITTYEYDKNKNISRIIAPEGKTTDIYYDDLDRVKQITEGKKDEIGRISLFFYDKVGNLTKEIDCNNNTIKYKYDDMNRLIEVTNEEGSIRKIFYDKEGNITKTIEPEQYHKNGENAVGTSYKYDTLSRLKEVKNALGVIVNEKIYNTSGEIIEEVKALNRKVNYTYDIGGRRKEVSVLRKEEKIDQQYEYDSLGNITGVKDFNGNKTKFKLDLWGRIKEVEKADKTLEKYSYDCAGNVISTVDGEGKNLKYEYNSLNLISKRIDQEGNKEVFKYNKEGQIANYIDRNGNNVEYLYNIDGNIARREETKSKIFEEYSYNKDGTIKSLTNGRDLYTYEYTKTRNPQSKSINGQKVLSYIYDKDSNLSQLRDISGQTTNYSYDVIGRLTNINRGIESADYIYNQDNTISSVHYGNAVAINYDYDELMNISGIKATNENNQEVFKNTYNYDKNGNRIETIEDDKSTKYSYDALDRLRKVEYPDYTEEFIYDKSGNRIEKIKNGESTTYFYDIRNRLTRKIERNIETKYGYDKQGNLKEEEKLNKKTTYTYDNFNRSVKIEKSNGTYQENKYNPEGYRNEVDENGKITKFIFNGNKVVSELDGDNNPKEAILRGNGLISKKDNENNVYYYISNAHGDIRKLTDQEGNTSNSYSYDAFGNTTSELENINNRFKYTGEQFDSVTGQYYLRARFYNPTIGRFTQEDNYRGDGLNLYSYVRNNPLMYIDPSGYARIDVTAATEDIRRILGNPNESIPSKRNGAFYTWFDNLNVDHLDEMYDTQNTKNFLKKRLRPGYKHEWFPVAAANTFKRWGIKGQDIADTATRIKNPDIIFAMPDPNNPEGEWLRGFHTNTSVATHAHNDIFRIVEEVDAMPISGTMKIETYVTRLRAWVDEGHWVTSINGREVVRTSNDLPGFLQRGQEPLPNHLQSSSQQQNGQQGSGNSDDGCED